VLQGTLHPSALPSRARSTGEPGRGGLFLAADQAAHRPAVWWYPSSVDRTQRPGPLDVACPKPTARTAWPVDRFPADHKPPPGEPLAIRRTRDVMERAEHVPRAAPQA